MNQEKKINKILFATYLWSIIPKAINKIKNSNESFFIYVEKKYIKILLQLLKNHSNFLFKHITDLFIVDYPTKLKRFEINYVVTSLFYNSKLICKTFLEDNAALETISSVYKGAVWLEREGWDLFGVFFSKTPDLRRILTDYGFNGFPLRKDFPLSGYIEVRYDIEKQLVVYEPLELSQEFRFFDFKNSWINKN